MFLFSFAANPAGAGSTALWWQRSVGSAKMRLWMAGAHAGLPVLDMKTLEAANFTDWADKGKGQARPHQGADRAGPKQGWRTGPG